MKPLIVSQSINSYLATKPNGFFTYSKQRATDHLTKLHTLRQVKPPKPRLSSVLLLTYIKI